MLDIFSRKVIHWEVHYGESGDLAKAFMQHAITANGGARPRYIHADNGTSMTSKNVATLLTDLNITAAIPAARLQRQPYSEAAQDPQILPVFPGTFAAWTTHALASFFAYYNNEHRHSGIGLHTPATVHDGTAGPSRPAAAGLDDASPGEVRGAQGARRPPGLGLVRSPAQGGVGGE